MNPFKLIIEIDKDGNSVMHCDPPEMMKEIIFIRNTLFNQYKEMDYAVSARKTLNAMRNMPKITRAVMADPVLNKLKKNIM